MGFLIDIAEIAGLLFIAYVVGWFVGYFAHRLTARAVPGLEAAVTQGPPATEAPDSDALVRAPVVVAVATAPPPRVLAAATALEPVKATAVPGAHEPTSQPDAEPAPPPVSALDTLKSLSTAMPLMPPDEPPQPVEVVPEVAEETSAPILSAPASIAESPEPPALVATAEPVASATPVAVLSAIEPPPPVPASVPIERAASDVAVAIAPAVTLVEPAATPVAKVDAPIPAAAPSAVAAAAPPARVKQKIRIAPATRAGETAARPAEPPPMPASAPGMPWAGAIKGQEAQKFAPDAVPAAAGIAAPSEPDDPIPEPDAALDVALLSSMADQLKLAPDAPPAREEAPVAAIEPAAALRAEQLEVATTDPSPGQPDEPAPAPVSEAPPEEPIVVPPEPVVSPPEPAPLLPIEPAQPPPRRPALDEDAAMRAIEGGWSRRDVRALGDALEFTDVSAAVSAAQVAVEQVLARNGVDTAEPDSRAQASFGKPNGLPQPRDGRRDSLKRIDGLGPLDEVTLNNLGIYHFDQIAKWTEREVLWLENHAFAVGRIGREDWQEQARELVAERDATRALR